MEQYTTSLLHAAILADFEGQLRIALHTDDEAASTALADRYFSQYPWLVGAFYRNVYLRGRRRALEARVRTLDRLIAGHNPKTVRYLSEGWRHQRDETAAELRELEGQAALDPPPWAQVLQQFRAQLQRPEGREAER